MAVQDLIVPMRVREEGREERSAPVLVSVNIEADTQSASRRQLMCFQLTDESDPFFLYSLKISEEEFQAVKVDQSILVDFAEFPDMFMQLLKSCLTADGNEQPKFTTSLVATSSSASLNIVETNQFQNLTRLRLEIRSGNDGAVKRYLAGELGKTKRERDSLQAMLEETQQRLRTQAQDNEAQLDAARASEAEAQKELGRVKMEHASVCAELREQAAQLQQELQQKSESDRSSMEKSHRDKELGLQRQVEELRGRMDALGEEKAALQEQNRELAMKLKSSDQELASCREDLSALREENMKSDRIRHEQEKSLQANAIRLSTLEQQVADGKAMNQQVNQLVESAQAQKATLEENIRIMRGSNEALEEKVRQSGTELAKATEFLQRLQSEFKATKAKLKVKMAVVMQQEKVVQDKDGEIAEAARKAALLHQTISERDGQLELLQARLSQAEAKFEEAERTLASNQQVISWLNKEVNEAQMASRGAFRASTLTEMCGDSASTFRPTLPFSNLQTISGADSLASKMSIPAPDSSPGSYRMGQGVSPSTSSLPSSGPPKPGGIVWRPDEGLLPATSIMTSSRDTRQVEYRPPQKGMGHAEHSASLLSAT